MNRPPRKFQVGDRVAYGVAWLRSTGNITGNLPRLRGSITELQPFGLGQIAFIAWDNYRVKSEYRDDGLGHVLTSNLTLVSRIAINSALNT